MLICGYTHMVAYLSCHQVSLLPLPDRVPPVLVIFSLHSSSAGLPCRLCLSYGLQARTHEVHRSSLRRLMCPSPEHFISLTLPIISMTFVLSLTQMLAFLYLYVMLSRKFVLCLFGECPCCTICHSWQHT